MNKNVLVFGLVFFVLLTLASTGALAVNINSCNATLSANNVYTLNTSVNINNKTCFNITATNVTINCNGYSISGDNTTGTYGVYSTANRTTIQNCNIQGFAYGLYYNSVSNGVLSNDYVYSSTAWAVQLYSGKYNTIQNVNAIGLSFGIYLNANTLSTISNSNGTGTTSLGLGLYGSSYNSLTNVVGISRDLNGIYLYGNSNNNNVTGGYAQTSYTQVGGLKIDSSSNNKIVNVNAFSFIGASGAAFVINKANNTILSNVTGNATLGYGVWMGGSGSNNTVSYSMMSTGGSASAAVWIEGGISATFYNNTITSNNTADAVNIVSNSGKAVFYWNKISSLGYYIDNNVSTSLFNTSVGGVAQGNYYAGISALNITDNNSDGWGDSGSAYPLKNTTWSAKWRGYGADYGPAVFDFSLSVNPSLGSVKQNSNVVSTISISLIKGVSTIVNLSLVGCPANTVCSLSSVGGLISFNSTLSVTTSNSTPVGVYSLNISGVGGGLARNVIYTLNVTDSQPIASASASPSSGNTPLNVFFNGSVSGGDAPFTYLWNFADGTNSTLQNTAHNFTSAGTYVISFKVTDNDGDVSTSNVSVHVYGSLPNTCGDVNSPNTVYLLTQNIFAHGITCINIYASNVTIDCNGYSISGDNTTGTYGVYSTASKTIIQNCAIRDFDTGIFYDGSINDVQYGVIRNNNIVATGNRFFDDVTSPGIFIEEGHYDTIYNNTIASIRGDGIGLAFSYNQFGYNNITFNNITYSYQYGIDMVSEFKDTITNNVVNGGLGIELWGVGHVVTNNTFFGKRGMELRGTYNTVVANNNITGTDADGVYIYVGSINNTLTSNSIDGGQWGDNGALVLSSSSNNNVLSNTITCNHGCYYGVLFADGRSNNNLLINNTVGTVRISIFVDYGSMSNKIYWNNLTLASQYFIVNRNETSNMFNTSVNGTPQGNYYYNISSLNITDSDSDGWGDSGSAYPLSSSTWSKWLGLGADYGPHI